MKTVVKIQLDST